MFISRSSQYVLHALIYLALQPGDRPVLAREMSERLGIPLQYLSKLLQPLGHAGLLESSRGRGGGYRLLPGAAGTTLLDIILLLDHQRLSTDCLLGFKDCEDDNACVLHCRWKPVKEELLDHFGQCTLAQLANRQPPLPEALWRELQLPLDGD